jgi:hypothetical protein
MDTDTSIKRTESKRNKLPPKITMDFIATMTTSALSANPACYVLGIHKIYFMYYPGVVVILLHLGISWAAGNEDTVYCISQGLAGLERNTYTWLFRIKVN